MLFLFLQGMFSACKEWNCIIFLSPLLLSPCLVDKQHTSPLSWGTDEDVGRGQSQTVRRRGGEGGRSKKEGREGGEKEGGGDEREKAGKMN